MQNVLQNGGVSFHKMVSAAPSVVKKHIPVIWKLQKIQPKISSAIIAMMQKTKTQSFYEKIIQETLK
jgi:hypothetical protein